MSTNTQHAKESEVRTESNQVEEMPNITEAQNIINKNLEKIDSTLKDGIYVIEKPNQSAQVIGDVGMTTTFKKFETIISIKNPYKRDALIKEIRIVPDEFFRVHGILLITTNNVKLFNSTTAGYFDTTVMGLSLADIPEIISFPHGIKLQRDEKIEFIAKHTGDVNQIKLVARVTFVIWLNPTT